MSNSMMQITPARSATNLIRNALAIKNLDGGTSASIEFIFRCGTGANKKGGTSDTFDDGTSDALKNVEKFSRLSKVSAH